MKGHIQQRGKKSWRLKFDAGRDSTTGKRKIQYVTFRGSKREAQNKLAALIASVTNATYVEPAKTTVAQHVSARIHAWEASGQISARTAQRYRELLKGQIEPHIGQNAVQKLRPVDVELWHIALASNGRAKGKGGIAPRTIRHAHRVLSQALKDAVTDGDLLSKNVAALKPPPKVADEEMVIVRDVPGLFARLAGSRLRVPALLAVFTGMRLGEILALRWGRVDLEAKVILVREAVEYTEAHGLRFKAPKTKAGSRAITLPDVLVTVLRDFRKERLQMGLQAVSSNALLFGSEYGDPPTPNAFSAAWSDFAEAIRIPEVSFHALRHTHASQLIDQGVDPVTISKRLGHAKPDITLRVYAHLFQKDDAKAAEAINAVWTKA
jgi:integrase